jgi:phosphoribosyl 1,2-cyclic phosphate phosphodiesterase
MSDNPKNKRLRASVVFENDTGARLLIDASPDLRQQALRANVSEVDALIITHAHADHCHGLDDFRPFNFAKNAPIPLHATPEVLQELRTRFAYVFKEHKLEYGWYKPAFTLHDVMLENDVAHVEIAGMHVTLIRQVHGRVESLGVRVGELAYSTDVNHFSEEAFAALKGVKIWVVDCLRYALAPTHAHLAQTLEWIDRVKPQRAILTHMAHELEYEALRAMLPAGVEPAYDGMVVTF